MSIGVLRNKRKVEGFFVQNIIASGFKRKGSFNEVKDNLYLPIEECLIIIENLG